MSRLMIGDVTLNVIQKGQGRPLLLVHGFPLDHRMWQGQIDDLAEDFQVIAPDLRGFGDSDASTGVVSMQQYADDLARLLDQLGIPQKVVFCGLSMGGYIAWQFWRRHGDRLSHLVLCDTRSAADAPDVAQTRLETAERVLQEGTALLVESMIPKLFSERTRQQNPSTVMATAKVIAAAQPVGVAAALRGMAQRVDATAWLPEIGLPTLVVCGQHDAISGVPEMEGIADAIPAAQFVVIAGCGHMAPLEGPVHFNQAVRRFLGEARRA